MELVVRRAFRQRLDRLAEPVEGVRGDLRQQDGALECGRLAARSSVSRSRKYRSSSMASSISARSSAVLLREPLPQPREGASVVVLQAGRLRIGARAGRRGRVPVRQASDPGRALARSGSAHSGSHEGRARRAQHRDPAGRDAELMERLGSSPEADARIVGEHLLVLRGDEKRAEPDAGIAVWGRGLSAIGGPRTRAASATPSPGTSARPCAASFRARASGAASPATTSASTSAKELATLLPLRTATVSSTTSTWFRPRRLSPCAARPQLRDGRERRAAAAAAERARRRSSGSGTPTGRRGAQARAGLLGRQLQLPDAGLILDPAAAVIPERSNRRPDVS